MKEFLHQHGIAFENKDMKKDESLRDIIDAKYGTRKAPIVEVGEDAVIGGGQWTEENWADLKKLLNIH